MVKTKGPSKDFEQNSVRDSSGDKKYFTMIPNFLLLLCDPFEYKLYSVYKSLAGEDGECWLSTPQLAARCGMSEGKVTECRTSLMKKGLIEGNMRQDPGYLPLWHITISNIWERNYKWAELYPDQEAINRFAMDHKENSGSEIEKECSRCHRTFIATGRRAYRCPPCQEAARKEQKDADHWLREAGASYIEREGAFCRQCGSEDSKLELHLYKGGDGCEIICNKCHDAVHEKDTKEISIWDIHDMNISENEVGHSCHESLPSPHECPTPRDECPTSPHESYNMDLKIDSYMDTKTAQNPYEIWDQISEMMKGQVSKKDYDLWLKDISGFEPSIEKNVLIVEVVNSYFRNWLWLNRELIKQNLACINSSLDFKIYYFGSEWKG